MSDNRIIKFRIWDKINKKFWFLSDYDLLCGERDFCCYSHESIEKLKPVVQQFIGLKDKKRKPIYEGDLVNFTIPGITHGPEREDLTSQEVHWAQEEGCWAFGRWGNNYAPGEIYYSIPGDRIDSSSFEIVGNIFENPELVTTE